MMKKLRIGGMIATGTAFSIMAYYAHQLNYFSADLTISRIIQQFDGVMPDFMYGVSCISNRIPAAIIVVITSIWLGKKGHRLGAILAGAASGVMAIAIIPLIKILVGRPRPTPDLIQVLSHDTSNSFPSGHATFVMVFYGFIFYLLPTLTDNKIIIRTGRVLIGLLIGLTFTSRIYLGMHWASDILGGFLISGLVLLGIISIYCHYQARFSERGRNAGAA